MRNINDYKILGLEPGATYSQIRKAYKQLAKKSHPDKIKNHQENHELDFKKIKQAYESLKEIQMPLKKRKRLLSRLNTKYQNFNYAISNQQIRSITLYLDTCQSSDSEDNLFYMSQALRVNNLKQMTRRILMREKNDKKILQRCKQVQQQQVEKVDKLNKIREIFEMQQSSISESNESHNSQDEQQQQQQQQQQSGQDMIRKLRSLGQRIIKGQRASSKLFK